MAPLRQALHLRIAFPGMCPGDLVMEAVPEDYADMGVREVLFQFDRHFNGERIAYIYAVYRLAILCDLYLHEPPELVPDAVLSQAQVDHLDVLLIVDIEINGLAD